MSIAQSILEIVLEEGKRHCLEKVNTIRLQIGAMAAVVPDSLTFCFELLSKDTIASGTKLEIETIPVIAKCNECNIHFEVEDYVFLCPECNQPALDLVSGRELSVQSIEGETGDNHDRD
jgi:hydrogenase nickel incorporation protein HypA/HybF